MGFGEYIVDIKGNADIAIKADTKMATTRKEGKRSGIRDKKCND